MYNIKNILKIPIVLLWEFFVFIRNAGAMNCRYIVSVFLLIMCCPYFSAAQKENNVWVFGHNNGLDFNSGSPVFFQTNIVTWEGAASVSDESGNLLFYSNGNQVWDANGNVMPNGSGLLGNGSLLPTLPGSSTQGVAIVRSMSNSQRYYIFVLEAIDNVIFPPFVPAHLRYTVVDMSLNSGLGDVVATEKNIVLDTGIGEQMCVVRGQGCYYWLLVHSLNTPEYKAFKIDAAGIQPPVVSPGIYKNYLAGEMKLSPDETKLALIVQTNTDTFDAQCAIELGNFNRTTGTVSGIITIDQANAYNKYGLSFSPDNSKLYSSNYPVNLVQYDISAYPNGIAIDNSKTVIATGGFGGMRMGPDQKIYITPAWNGSVAYLSRINNPDLPGAACNLNVNALLLPAYSFFPGSNNVTIGLGNPVVSLGEDTATSLEEITLCKGASITLAVAEDYENFKWENGSTESERVINEPGIYWVMDETKCRISIDSFKVYGITPALRIMEPDTLLCHGANITLHLQAEPASSYLWNTGSTADSILVSEAGVFTVTATNNCGSFSDSVRISYEECDCRPFVPNAFSPNGDGRNDLFEAKINCPVSYYAFSVYNRYGQRIFLSTNPKTLWDGTFNGRPVDGGIYFYYLTFKNRDKISFERKGDITLIR